MELSSNSPRVRQTFAHTKNAGLSAASVTRNFPSFSANVAFTSVFARSWFMKRSNIHSLDTLSADKPAFFVWANVWQTRGEFDDNSFTLYPGEPRTLVFTPKTPGLTLDAFKKAFSVTHLRETYR